MIIKYKKIDIPTMKLSAETYEGELFYDEIQLISKHLKGILIYSYSKREIVIIDTDTGVNLKKLKPSEYMKFIYDNCEESDVDWDPEVDGEVVFGRVNGELTDIKDN